MVAEWILYVPVNNLSVMPGRVLLGRPILSPGKKLTVTPAQMSLLVCVAVQKKLNFDLLTLSSGSWGGGG